MSRIVLATSGSFGDLHPYIAVGVGLLARGHDVTIATVETYREKVTGEGLSFRPVRPDIAPSLYNPEVFARANDLRTGTEYLLRELVLPHVEEMYEDLLEAATGADLFVIHQVLFAAPLVAEKLKLKWASVVLAPSAFVSAYDPPLLPPLPWLHPLRHLGPLPNHLMFQLFRKLTRKWMKPVDDLRRRLGLPPAEKHPIHDGMFSPLATLAWFSPVLGSPKPDWPINTQITGYAFYDRRDAHEGIDCELLDFVRAGEPPVIFTLGSSAVIDAGNFYQHSFEAIEQLGRRAVFLIGSEPKNRPRGVIPPSVFLAEYAPYSELFPYAAAIVHQGGAGTTGQALRAGVPMLVVPFMHDQPDNAFRVKCLGVARVLSRARYNAASAASELNLLLHRPEYATKARSIGAHVRLENGVADACLALERLLDDDGHAALHAGLESRSSSIR